MQPGQHQVSCGQRVLGDPQRVLAVALPAYIAMNTAGRVVAWNPAAQTTFGYCFDEACGEDLAELIIPPRYRQAHRERVASLAAGAPGRKLGQRLELTDLTRPRRSL
ncbi:hypothetical protein Aca07nite_47740 [Actinoplanes capillaceus]|uniref:PAS domain-containing protein n=1 Tax=Actinoplanes campanulatus TaxID=113559 RepID=A0ABQ3WMM6_9ACTN|nr:PAS domain-containing protein [Actinoplanes capillaceus]GID47499.1 hypothetical protein Aca07nite_47740 [Actinoplanes capillaceus]